MEDLNKDNEEKIFQKDNYIIKLILKTEYLSLVILDSSTNEEYKTNLTKEFLSNKNIFFSYLSIIGIKDFFINLMKQSKYEIKKDISKLKLTLFLDNKTQNIDIIIPLFNKDCSNNDIILLKSENLNLKEDIKKLKEEINEINKRLKKIESEIDNNKDQWKGFTNKIIKNKDEVKILLDWINPNDKLKVKLLYDASLQENTNNNFHEKCDGKGATIVLVESANGKRFGGYTRISWNNNINTWMKDTTAFLFNLDDNKKYKVLKPEYAIYGDNRYGPHFGNSNDFTPGHPNGSKYFIGGSHPSNPNGNYTYESKEKELSGDNNFKIVAMEVYKVILE